MSLNKINIVIAGSTGYVGLDLVKILSSHPNVKIINLCAKKKIGKNIQFFDKRIKKKLPKISNLKNVKWEKIDILFTSLPSLNSQNLVAKLSKYKKLKIIDLSADFRLSNKNKFKEFYFSDHKAPNFIKKSIYAVSEFVKKDIKKFKIIACPGCYATSIQIPLIPLIKKGLIKNEDIIIDSKSGYSGAGKNLKKRFKHKNLYSSIYAYNVFKHRHTAELDQEFSKVSKSNIKYSFIRNLIPTFRGMLTSIYIKPNKNVSIKKIHKELKNFHKKNSFIKVFPINKDIGTENVINTNRCEISVCQLKEKNRILILSALDNLIKGAAGQAVQNMNLIFGFNEKQGLK